MSIEIMTYRSPYQLCKEPYWDDIKSCPYFCVSQTTVNGLKRIYPNDFKPGRVATVQRLTSALFKDWESTANMVCQHTDIDNIITNGLPLEFESPILENIEQAFRFNRDEVYTSLRVMFELDVDIDAIRLEKLTYEQRFIVEIYRKILCSEKKKDFSLIKNLDIEQIDRAIGKAMQDAKNASNDKAEIVLSEIEQDRIVIHGVHQFSPILLRAIEEISRFKRVILLFNYQPQYKNVYQTWFDIYTAFDCPITDSSCSEFHPDQALTSYQGNLLADNLGKLIEGRIDQLSFDQNYQITEFDNMTEFAGYVAQVFENARSEDPINPMGRMREQIYSANGAVNDILKIYFPEQFGERQFLDYPLGHFFLAIANMWDSENNQIQIRSVDDIRECFDAGIFKEEYTGQISTIFGKVDALFDGVATLDEMIKRLRKLSKNRKYLSDPEEIESLSHISYYSLSKEELDILLNSLIELQDMAQYFYEDFEKHAHNFREFYRKLKGYLQQDILDARELDEDFADIIGRVLERLEEVKDIDASASFECLKSTMSIYLVQETKPGKSANWIVRNFEQIDGDITRSDRKSAHNVVYHFACLTDEDMASLKRPDFSWPLNTDFFELAQDPVDWKYQVFVKARTEYKNFKRYALIYGLEFNRGQFKLSYVKRVGDKEHEMYYPLKILGTTVLPYKDMRIGNSYIQTSSIDALGTPNAKFNEYDLFRYRICKYRFLLESLTEGTTVYKDNFLLNKYMEVMLENRIREDMQEMPVSETLLDSNLNDDYDSLKKHFPFVVGMNRMDVIGNVRKRILSTKATTFPSLGLNERRYMMTRELFIYRKLEDLHGGRKNVMQGIFEPATQEQIDRKLSPEALESVQFDQRTDLWCQYCANRETCAACYTATERY